MASPASPVHLEWVAPEGCPTHDEVLGAIARIVGTGDSGSPVDARVIVTQADREFRAEATVSASGATSTRSLTGESCRAIADAAAIVVALAANPVPSPPPAPAPSPRPSPPPPLPAPARAPPAPEGASSPKRPPLRHVFFVDAAFLIDSGLLPSVGLGGELEAGWSPAHWDLEIVGAFLGTQRITLTSLPTQGADVWLAHLGARACYPVLDSRLDLGPCLGAGVEWVTARGFGAVHTENATGSMAVGSLGAKATVRLSSRIALRLVGEAVVPWARPTFVIDGGGQVFQTAGASFRASLGAEAHF